MSSDTETGAGNSNGTDKTGKGEGSGLSAGGPEHRSSPVRTGGLWLLLLALLLFAGVQEAGILLRDRVEGRIPRLAGPPATSEAPPGAVAPAGETPRFGPQVREVTVASTSEDTLPPPKPKAEPPPEPPRAPEPATEPPAPPPEAVEAAQGEEVRPAEPAPPEESAPPVPAATTEPPPPAKLVETSEPEGTHVLQMGVFRSQLYRQEVERQLDQLGISHYREEGSTEGAGYRVVIDTETPEERAKARKVLEDHDFAFREEDGKIEAILYLEQEAQRVLALLTRSGLAGGYGRIEGRVPLWTVFAGPFDLEEAKAVRERLKKEGLPAFLRRRP